MKTTVKPSDKLTFRDRLSHLTVQQAEKLLGKQGRQFIRLGAKWGVDLQRDVYLRGDLLRVKLRNPDDSVAAIPTLTAKADARFNLHWNCDRCDGACEHVGALFSVILEDKMQLGLSVAPPEAEKVEPPTEEGLEEQAVADRQQRAADEKMKIKSADASTPWTDYIVTSLVSGKAYRVALRGMAAGESYCNCPDFRTNTLGTCKHVLKVASSVKRKFTAAQLKKAYRRRQIEIFLNYQGDVSLRLAAPEKLPPEVEKLVAPLGNKPLIDIPALMRALKRLEALEQPFIIYPDAEEFVQQRLHQLRMRELVSEIRRDPKQHPLRTSLLKIPLLPYQLDGIAFVAGVGRAVLADDMGLGKTIQGVGVAEFLAREADIRKVLIVCPASLKSQWRNEIARFCGRESQIISGPIALRAEQYQNDAFFSICNYEQVLKDILAIERTPWDLIILDEGQRIKNWESKTSRVIKGLKSKFALVLSGTPLENRLDELYSVVQFIDDRRLGPGFRFFHEHRMLDDKGKVVGYKNLDQLRQRLAPVLLRRTRDSVQLELPERTTEIIRIPPSAEQLGMHHAHMQTVASIVRRKYITEMDLLRLRAALLMCRMSANGTFLVDKELPNHSTKLARLAEIFDDLADEASRKVVLFSEWTTMLDLIEPLLKERKLSFVRLDGSVPQRKREEIVNEFQNNPQCRFFLTTNAGSTGLNLQAANTVINVDLPWNPAVLEQRIARAHRMGQTRNVQVFVLVTEQTLEENLLATLTAKRELALAALDPQSNVDQVDLTTGTEELKSRLEILLGAKPQAPLDETKQTEAQEQAAVVQQRQRVSAAGGELLGAAFRFLGELVSTTTTAPAPSETIVRNVRQQLDQCVEVDASGQARFSVTLPSTAALEDLAKALSQLLVAGSPPASL